MNAQAQPASGPGGGEKLAGRTVAFLIPGDGAGQAETLQPWDAVTQAGGRPVLVGPERGEAHLSDERGYGLHVPVDTRLADAREPDFDALVVPGGPNGPAGLGSDPDAVRFLTAFFLAGKPIAAAGRAPELLLEADLAQDRMLTSAPELASAVEDAGGAWYDYPVVVCHNGPNMLLTGRAAADVPAFCDALVDEFAATLAQHGPPRGMAEMTRS
ncbi:DJ-1/PfpI family protein [Actinospica robiniae]|uniref:DJ-1/PfpI family protein n=1 Tax=Actinospica robiniae TaxID=304901 RepID=UPI0004131F1A|nr:DJ-1/PfpI family protein [Actinospica robiniae]